MFLSKIRHKAILYCLCVLMVLWAGGCGKAPQAGQPGGQAPAIIDIWYSLQGAAANALQTQVQTIMKAHPEVLIKLKYVPEQNFVALSYQAEAGGEGPELFIASQDILRQLYERGALAKSAYTDQESFPAAIANLRWNGIEYAVPWLTDVPLLYYRTDTAGIPTSLTDLFSTKGGISLTTPSTATLSAWWNGQGGRLVNAGNPVLNDPSNLTFLQQLLTWQSAKVLRIDPNALTAFSSGQTPYFIGWASQARLLTQQKIPWGSVPLNNLLSGQGHSLLSTTLGIADSAIKTSTALMPAIQVVEAALLAPQVEGAMYKAGSLLPANMSYYQLSEAQQGVLPQAKAALSEAWALEGDAPEWKLIPLQDTAWANALAGNAAPQDALNSAQVQAGKVLSAKS